ncbi:WAT1-related protein At2g37460-like isoform X2 [Malania oleifera]|uniref:WAT1-related protein At2g37460-like isoform X2 n=1 Tax=Malania oleifera TaxID=397392 RepID=UPI0025AE066E|nr:WAT1-related protein At2g37460-like isoform X2 [Malania oleifera]
MELMRRLGAVLEACKPYLYQILIQLCLAIFLILVQIIVSKGISAIVIVVYEHVLSTIALSLLAFFLEKDRRPSLSFKILCYAFVLGLLQVTLCQMLLTMSLEFVSSTYQSVALNLVPSIVFALALAFKQEKLKFQSINGQAKIWGLASSAAGALALLLWKGPVLLKSTLYKSFMATSAGLIGGTMIVVGILASAFWHILVRHVTRKYPAELSLTAMMNLFGSLQTATVSAFVVKGSSWDLKWDGGLSLITVLLGTFVLGNSPHLGSVVGAVFVIAGLYLLLWGKAKETEEEQLNGAVDFIDSPLIQQ